MSWFSAWFGYGLGAATGKALFGYGAPEKRPPPAPIRSMTEEDIRADERRFAEDARRLDEADRGRRP